MLYSCMCRSVHSQLHAYDSSVIYSLLFSLVLDCGCILLFIFRVIFLFTNTFFDMVSYLFSLRIGRFFTYLMVCLLSTLCNWGVESVGAAHPWRMVLPYTINLHSYVDVQSGGNDLDWDALYGLLRSVHARGLLLAPAVATAGQ